MQVPDRLTPPGDDNIALVNAGTRAWALRIDGDDDGARLVASLDGDQLEPKPKVATRDAP